MFRSNALALLLALLAVATAQTLNVVNKCTKSVFLSTQTTNGTVANNVPLDPGATADMHISSDWNGNINVGTQCDGNGNCATGGPTWDGRTPFSRAEFNYFTVPGSVTYDISFVYGSNVGMEITPGSGQGCIDFACTLPGGCPVPGPDGSCFSGCCSSAQACQGGTLPPGGGGCPQNKFAGPHTPFYTNNCQNAYAFPDNDGTDGATPANFVDTTCKNTAMITLTLCSGKTTHIPKS